MDVLEVLSLSWIRQFGVWYAYNISAIRNVDVFYRENLLTKPPSTILRDNIIKKYSIIYIPTLCDVRKNCVILSKTAAAE